MATVNAVILGGGRGSRLLPLTQKRAKPAVGLAGKYRLIDIPISNCINSKITKMFVVTQFLSVSLHRHIMKTYIFDSFSGGFIDVLPAQQTLARDNWFQGTADAVRGTLNHITYFKSDATLILSGDHLYRMDYRQLVERHLETKADITLGVYPVQRSQASQMGLLKVDGKARVLDFAEKPQKQETVDKYRAPQDLCRLAGLDHKQDLFLASMGIYVFNPDVLVDLLTQTEQVDFGKELLPAAIGSHNVMAYPFADYWQDIGTIQAFFEANVLLAQPDPPFRLYEPGWPIYTRSRSLPPCRVIKSDIQDSLLSEGSNIQGAKIVDSVIGVRSVVSPGSQLSEVVMLGADFFEGDLKARTMSAKPDESVPMGVGPGCRIERAIIDKNARIGAGVRITRKPPDVVVESANHWIKDGITVIPKSAVLHPGEII